MKSTKRELSEALERIGGVPMLAVGDLILDRYVWGDVSRISPEAPVPVVEVVRTEDRLGGAANVARNLRSLDARVTMCGFVGDDEEGHRVMELLDRDGVSKDGVIIDRNRPRAQAALRYLASLATETNRVLHVRLVKGAYWDAEIKRSQERGMPGYPVFTRKPNTDVSYLACSRKKVTGTGQGRKRF